MHLVKSCTRLLYNGVQIFISKIEESRLMATSESSICIIILLMFFLLFLPLTICQIYRQQKKNRSTYDSFSSYFIIQLQVILSAGLCFRSIVFNASASGFLSYKTIPNSTRLFLFAFSFFRIFSQFCTSWTLYTNVSENRLQDWKIFGIICVWENLRCKGGLPLHLFTWYFCLREEVFSLLLVLLKREEV